MHSGPTVIAFISTIFPLFAAVVIVTKARPTNTKAQRQSRFLIVLFVWIGALRIPTLVDQILQHSDRRPTWIVAGMVFPSLVVTWTTVSPILRRPYHEKMLSFVTGFIISASLANLVWFLTVNEKLSRVNYSFETSAIGIAYPVVLFVMLASCATRFSWYQMQGRELNPIGLLGVLLFTFSELDYAWEYLQQTDSVSSTAALGAAIGPILISYAFISDITVASFSPIQRINRRRGFWLVGYSPIIFLLIVEALGHNNNVHERVSTLILGAVILLLIARVVITQRELALRGNVLRERSLEKTHEINRLQVLNQRIIDVSSDGIVAANSQNTIISCNPAAREILGLLPDEELPYSMHDLFHRDPNCSKRCEVSRALHPSAHEHSHIDIRLADREIIIETSVRPIDGPSFGYVVIFHDVTSQIMLARMKEHIISVVSHEIRTPLTTIRGSLGLIKSGLFGKIEGEAKELMTLAIENSDRVMILVNDLLDLDRIASKRARLNFQSTDVDELLSQAVRQVSILSNRKSINIIFTSDHHKIIADRDRILQVLTNLLHNSIKFSPEGSLIELTCETDEQSTTFAVKDQGRGIPPTELESVFEPFNQLSDSDSRHGDGSGLGLSICKGIIESHGGSIRAKLRETGGTTIEFSIPPPHRSNLSPPST